MLISAVHGIRNLTKEKFECKYEKSKILNFGKNYILPKAMDPRLIQVIPSLISDTALKTNVV